jgi:hypothetical protein
VAVVDEVVAVAGLERLQKKNLFLRKMLRDAIQRVIRAILTVGKPPVQWGRWNRHDNVDIKATLANIDSCGDRLCGDVAATKAAIETYHKRPQAK